MNIRKDDNVIVISGKDKGKKGKVMTANPDKKTLIVSGINVGPKHKRAKGASEPGAIIDQERPINVSNVMLVCGKCDKATRIGKTVLENGKKVRVCKKCGEVIDK